MEAFSFAAESASGDVRVTVAIANVPSGMLLDLQVHLSQHTKVDSFWTATFGVKRVGADGDTWAGTMAWQPSEAPELLELTAVFIPMDLPEAWPMVAPSGSPLQIAVMTGMVLARPPGPDHVGHWTDGQASYEQLVLDREAMFDVELTAGWATPDDPLWSVIVLAEHMLLSQLSKVPGITVAPLNVDASRSRLNATAGLLTALAAEVGFRLPGAISFDAARSHLALVQLPRVRAEDGRQAISWSAEQSRKLLDLIGLNRNDSPALIAAAVGKRHIDGTVIFEGATSFGREYRGNLLTGMLSGEDVGLLVQQWNYLAADPRPSLWLRLFNEAIADARWDYRVLSFFNLLEGIGRQVVPKNTPVLDAACNPQLRSDGKPYTSAQARGTVYLLLQRVEHHMPLVGQADGTSVQADLWDEIELWVSIRNQVAHTGSWDLPPGVRPSSLWAMLNARLMSPGDRGQAVSAIQQAAESVLRSAISGLL